MKIKVKELLNKLDILKQIINENDFADIAKYFYFINKKLYTFNGRIFIAIDTDIELDKFKVNNQFYKVLQKIKTNEVDMELQDNKLLLKCKKTSIELIISDYDIKIYMDYGKFNKLPKEFLHAVKLTRFCLDKNTVDSAAYLHIKNNYMYATDKYRICRFNLKENIQDLMLPYDCLDLLLKAEVNEYVEEENFYVFRNNKISIGIFKSITTGLDFEKYNPVFDNVNNTKIKLPDDIKEYIELSELFTNDEIFQKEIEFIIKDKNLICKGKNIVGSVESTIDIDTNLNINFLIHPLFLMEVLNECNEMEINEDIAYFKNKDFCYFFRIKK